MKKYEKPVALISHIVFEDSVADSFATWLSGTGNEEAGVININLSSQSSAS